ncbi:MAG: ATP-binding cassette domain-containing protein, partial [Planctomycetes bacterium]|nr:ATP-binding cassette domain-containing protein [Planctomycetota bacterium]
MLEIRNLNVNYGSIGAIHGINIDVPKGQIVTLIGANGAGKSTTLRAISGIVRAREGSSIQFDGQEIAALPPHKIVERGLCHVPEGRMIFANLTVMENLLLGAYRRKDKKAFPNDLEYIFAIFPRLKERQKQSAATLSGGEQQM